MVNRPSVPEIITVNSESLQTQIRDLLPSQNGFGSELQATNVITPVIDLTSAAEGSGLPFSLQTAIAFGSQTAFDIKATTTVLANSPGFYRVVGVSTINNNATDGVNSFTMTDGASTKTVWLHSIDAAPTGDELNSPNIQFDLIFWLASGESVSGSSSKAQCHLGGSIRQVADSLGSLVNPSGYPL
jgi:hypothetical protein